MTSQRTRIATLLIVFLGPPIPVVGQMRAKLVVFQPTPTLAINTCSAGRRADGAVWDAIFATVGMERSPAKALLSALQDSLRVEAVEHPADVELQYLLAAVIGVRTEFERGRSQIRAAKALHAQAQIVLSLDPDHPGALHLLGRLHTAVLRMGRIKRFLATKVLGGSELSGASWDDAQRLLEVAVVGDPCVADHHYELALLYVDRGEIAMARERLQALLRLDLPASRDEVVTERAAVLLQRLEDGS